MWLSWDWILSNPMSWINLTASANPNTSTKAGVPASNFRGGLAKVVLSKVTVSIMSPPVRKGTMSSKRSYFPYRIPIPVEARTSGDAQLQVAVRSPDDARLLQLESARMLVRTTQLSGVGILLFVGAVVVLAVWWFRSARLRSRQSGEAI